MKAMLITDAAWVYAVFVLHKPRCAVHKVELICPACVGAAGGAQSSPSKRRAARENGKRGGRPRKAKEKGGN
jgi:hypothetical protein